MNATQKRTARGCGVVVLLAGVVTYARFIAPMLTPEPLDLAVSHADTDALHRQQRNGVTPEQAAEIHRAVNVGVWTPAERFQLDAIETGNLAATPEILGALRKATPPVDTPLNRERRAYELQLVDSRRR